MGEDNGKTEIDNAVDNNRESKNKDLGICVLLTIESLVSKMAGRTISLTDEEREIRLKQMGDATSLLDRKYERQAKSSLQSPFLRRLEQTLRDGMFSDRWGSVVARMDKVATSNYINSLKEGDSPVAGILRNAEIEFRTGSFSDAVKFAREGWQVGVMAPVPVQNKAITHIFHLGLDADNQPLDLSDDTGKYTKDTVTRMINTGQINQAVSWFRSRVGGWNIVLMRRSEQH